MILRASFICARQWGSMHADCWTEILKKKISHQKWPLWHFNSWIILPCMYFLERFAPPTCTPTVAHLSHTWRLQPKRYKQNEPLLRFPATGKEVSGTIRAAYPARDQRVHNPITHPCSSLNAHYPLPWRGLLGQMRNSPPQISPGTLVDTLGCDYKHHLFSTLTYPGLRSSLLKTNIIHCAQRSVRVPAV